MPKSMLDRAKRRKLTHEATAGFARGGIMDLDFLTAAEKASLERYDGPLWAAIKAYLQTPNADPNTIPDAAARAEMETLKGRVLMRFHQDIVLGRIKDPAYLAARAFGVGAHSIAILRFLDKVSRNPAWIFPASMVEWNGRKYSARFLLAEAQRLRSQVDEYPTDRQDLARRAADAMEAAASAGLADPPDPGVYQQVPNTKRYGVLRGMWVKKEIFDDLVNTAMPEWRDEQINWAFQQYRKAISFWKAGKTSLNLPTGHIRNHVSGVFQAQLFGGVPVHRLPDLYLRTMRDMATEGPGWRVAKRHGVRATSFAHAELMRIHDDFRLRLKLKHYGKNPVRLATEAAARFMDLAGDAYSLNEQFWKTLIIKHHMEQGMGEREAVQLANDAVFDYSLVPNWLRLTRENLPFGSPFITFAYKALPRSIEMALKYPFRLWPVLASIYGLHALTAYYQDVDDEEMEALHALLPEWMQGSQTVILPVKDRLGRWQPLDLGYYFPFGGWIKAVEALGDEGVIAALGEIGFSSHPGMNIPASLKHNRDTLGRQIYRPGDPAEQQLMDILAFLANQSLPPFMTPSGPVVQLMEALRGMPNRWGDPGRTPGQAVARLAGATIHPLDVATARRLGRARHEREINEAKRRFSEIRRDRSLSSSGRTAALDTQREEIQRRQKVYSEWRRVVSKAPSRSDSIAAR
jgi:hypothetical protein